MISLDNIGVSYGKYKILQSIDYSITENGIYGLLGPSGIGKTSLLQVLAVIKRQSEGELVIDGKNTKKYGIYERTVLWKKKLSFHFQINNVMPSKNIYFNIGMKYFPTYQERERMEIYCEKVNLRVSMSKKASTLSVGQKNRLSIVRAFYRDTPIVLLDEPLAALDKVSRKSVLDLMLEHAKSKIIIVSTHEDMLSEICTSSINLADHMVNT